MLLAFVLTFAQSLEDGEPCLFGIGDGERLGLDRGVESRNDLANRLPAGRADFQLCCTEWPTERKLTTAGQAVTVTEFVFVKRHLC